MAFWNFSNKSGVHLHDVHNIYSFDWKAAKAVSINISVLYDRTGCIQHAIFRHNGKFKQISIQSDLVLENFVGIIKSSLSPGFSISWDTLPYSFKNELVKEKGSLFRRSLSQGLSLHSSWEKALDINIFNLFHNVLYPVQKLFLITIENFTTIR